MTKVSLTVINFQLFHFLINDLRYLDISFNYIFYLCSEKFNHRIFMKKKNVLDIQKLEKAASRLRAMAHPMRIAMIELLTVNKRLTVTEIYERLGIEQAAASHHLNILKSKGLLESKRDGKMIHYSVRVQALSTVIECINQCSAE